MNQENVKGFLATGATGASVITAWLPAVESVLRIAVSIAGLIAAYYAARYWRKKAKLADAGKDKSEL